MTLINLTNKLYGLTKLNTFFFNNKNNIKNNINRQVNHNHRFNTFYIISNSLQRDLSRQVSLYSPSVIKTAYNIPEIKPINSRKVKIAIISAFHNPYLRADVSSFSKRFNLPNIDLDIYNFAGKKFNSVWALESLLDVCWAYAINPYAKIILIEARSNTQNDIFSAIKYANTLSPEIISMSLGSANKFNDTNLTNICNNPNICYLAASGNNKVPAWPSVTPNVLSIGATKLLVNDQNKRKNETPWINSGAGFSVNFARPVYQPQLNINTKNRRTVPDLVVNGDPETGVPVIARGRQLKLGGTSLATPMIAGMLSLAIQTRFNNNKESLTTVQNKGNSIQPLLYNKSIYSDCFNDITIGYAGNNKASIGFDSATGLGSINCQKLINYLAN